MRASSLSWRRFYPFGLFVQNLNRRLCQALVTVYWENALGRSAQCGMLALMTEINACTSASESLSER